ncbi:folylpolyglutamate synthase isoform X1 [Malania oleifera]|uniref:folylpolyglutamate synthase isoform X1 n=1 Tax=Malania oleifera TaxID=397392 RepID=UPI0025AE63C1|nr:folylpolyglutamate synthase isoform X1 [Malania oleifera]
MLINTNPYPKHKIFPVPAIHEGGQKLSARTTWSVSCLPACVDVRGLAGISIKYTKTSSQIMEKMGSNVIIKEHSQDEPFSSSYETAMEALSSLITCQKRGDKPATDNKYEKLDRMLIYLKILDLEEHISGLKIIHVAGTKGKGSTCTFCEAILRECGFRTGLFTSPHLIDVRERFRINGLDISEDMFLHYFWDCWNLLKEKVTDDLPMPPLFQFLTVLAFKIFISEKVDVAIIEVGLGGKTDSTNVIKEPVVCGIASLGMDHTETLGDTLEQIAMHKAGIFKPQIPALTVPQLSEAMDVLKARAHELMVPLKVVAPLDCKKLNGLKLSLSGDHQLINAGLAVSLCKSWLQITGNWEKLFQNDNRTADLPGAFLRGLSSARLAGRGQVVCDTSLKTYYSSEVTEKPSGDLIFYLDGAHSPESMEVCARWFSNAVRVNTDSSPYFNVRIMEEFWGNGHVRHGEESTDKSKIISKQILLFNCMEVRDPQILLPRLVNTCASSGTHFSKALFVPSMSTYKKVTSGASVIPLDIRSRDLSWQFNLQRIWERIIHGKDVVSDKNSQMDNPGTLPPPEFIYQDASHCCPKENVLSCSAVIPSLPLTIKWLRDCVKENPSLKVQVLVTGSLHLVGDVLKLLRKI